MRKIFWNVSGWTTAAVILIGLDQLSKYFAQAYLQTPYRLISDFFQLEYSQNTGIAFGISIPQIILIIGSPILIGLIIYLVFKELDLRKTLSILSLILIISGALGNLMDRLIHGFVIDFIAIWRWPNFNLADIYITLGILFMITFYGRINKVKKT
ncbi:MAG: signal peptidase II [Patescibacteria group bacterium]